MGSDEVLSAAAAGRLSTLLVSPEVDVWGRFDPATGEVLIHAKREPSDDELTNLAAVWVLRHGGVVDSVRAAELDGRNVLGLRWLPMDRHGKGGPSWGDCLAALP